MVKIHPIGLKGRSRIEPPASLRLRVNLKDCKIYDIMYDGSSLGDLFFVAGEPYRVRFYGWFPGGIPLEDLVKIFEEIQEFAEGK